MKKYTKDPAFVVQLNQYRQHKTNVITFNMCKMYTSAPIKWGKNCDYKITEYSMESLPKKVEMCMSVIMHVMVIN